MNKGVFCLFEKPTLRTKGKCNREMFPFAVAQVCAIPTDTCTAPIDQTGVEVSAVQLPVFGDAQKYQIRGFSLKCLSSCTSVSQHYLQTVAETTLRSTQEGFWGCLASEMRQWVLCSELVNPSSTGHWHGWGIFWELWEYSCRERCEPAGLNPATVGPHSLGSAPVQIIQDGDSASGLQDRREETLLWMVCMHFDSPERREWWQKKEQKRKLWRVKVVIDESKTL